MTAGSQVMCERCQDATSYCEACGGSSSREAMLGTAGARGRYWAAKVARVAPARCGEPWPPFQDKARVIALRLVADLGGDAVTRERRALFCWEQAKDEWENRLGPSR